MADHSKAAWPEENANTVKAYAEKHDHNQALETLKMIRSELFGDADRAEELSNWWGQNPVMIDCRNDVDTSRENLAAYWQGGAYDAYSTYATNIRISFDSNETMLNDIAWTMESCVGIVYETYRDAIEFISSCAHSLIERGVEVGWAIVAPPYAIWKASKEQVKVLNDFVKHVADLIAAAVSKMGALREKGIFLARQASDFREVRGPAAPIADPDLWAVKPKPKQPDEPQTQSAPSQSGPPQPGSGQPGQGQPGLGQPGQGQPGPEQGHPHLGMPGLGQPGQGQPGAGHTQPLLPPGQQPQPWNPLPPGQQPQPPFQQQPPQPQPLPLAPLQPQPQPLQPGPSDPPPVMPL